MKTSALAGVFLVLQTNDEILQTKLFFCKETSKFCKQIFNSAKKFFIPQTNIWAFAFRLRKASNLESFLLERIRRNFFSETAIGEGECYTSFKQQGGVL
jgi:hypothetical protein